MRANRGDGEVQKLGGKTAQQIWAAEGGGACQGTKWGQQGDKARQAQLQLSNSERRVRAGELLSHQLVCAQWLGVMHSRCLRFVVVWCVL